MMHRRRRPAAPATPGDEPFHAPECDSIIALWTLRLLVQGNALAKIRTKQRWPDADVLAAIGMDEGHADELDVIETQVLLDRRLDALEQKGVSGQEAFITNARLLGAQLSLSPLEQDIVALTAVASMGEGLSDCMRSIAPNSLQALSRTVGCALGVNAKRVREAFEPSAPLMSARLIRIQLGSGSTFSDAPLELADPLRDIFQRPHKDGDALLRSIFRTAARSEFGVDDFPHLAKDLPILLRFAKNAVAQGTTGVNILLHGPPDSGTLCTPLPTC